MSGEKIIEVRKSIYELMNGYDMVDVKAMLWAILGEVYGKTVEASPEYLRIAIWEMRDSFNLLETYVEKQSLK